MDRRKLASVVRIASTLRERQFLRCGLSASTSPGGSVVWANPPWPSHSPLHACPGHHDAVVGAEPRRRADQAQPRVGGHRRQAAAHVRVCRHAARHNQVPHLRQGRRAPGTRQAEAGSSRRGQHAGWGEAALQHLATPGWPAALHCRGAPALPLGATPAPTAPPAGTAPPGAAPPPAGRRRRCRRAAGGCPLRAAGVAGRSSTLAWARLGDGWLAALKAAYGMQYAAGSQPGHGKHAGTCRDSPQACGKPSGMVGRSRPSRASPVASGQRSSIASRTAVFSPA